MVRPAGPYAFGIQRVPACAVEAVDGARATRGGARKGGGGYALIVGEVIVIAGDELPAEIAAGRGFEGHRLGQVSLLGAVDAVGDGAGGNVVIEARDID